ncbi:MAG: hypothetical protein GY883_03510 [Shimia sp.]|nr:hypothetical protein [Shimia sp.]
MDVSDRRLFPTCRLMVTGLCHAFLGGPKELQTFFQTMDEQASKQRLLRLDTSTTAYQALKAIAYDNENERLAAVHGVGTSFASFARRILAFQMPSATFATEDINSAYDKTVVRVANTALLDCEMNIAQLVHAPLWHDSDEPVAGSINEDIYEIFHTAPEYDFWRK